jgi:SAM-dependent methyltransferase
VDVTREPLPTAAFEVIAVSGGLHHVAHFLDETFANIHQALKPRGMLVMFEPNGKYVLEAARRAWYRRDHYFDAETEQALDYVKLRDKYASLFEEEWAGYGGGPAYYLVLNSLVFRLPLSWKRWYAPPLTLIERAWNHIPFPYLQGFFLARWFRR